MTSERLGDGATDLVPVLGGDLPPAVDEFGIARGNRPQVRLGAAVDAAAVRGTGSSARRRGAGGGGITSPGQQPELPRAWLDLLSN